MFVNYYTLKNVLSDDFLNFVILKNVNIPIKGTLISRKEIKGWIEI